MLVGRLSRERLQVSSPASRVQWSGHQTAGYLLTISGTVEDTIAGWFLLGHADPWSILLHILAVPSWAAGLHILRRSGRAQTDASSRQIGTDVHCASGLVHSFKGRALALLRMPDFVALVLGLLMVPGLIPLSWCLGCTLAWAQRIPRRAGHYSLAAEGILPGEMPHDQPATDSARYPLVQGMPIEIDTLADATRDPSIEVRRGAIAILGQLGTPDAVALLRSLLTDCHADVRLDASTTLARLEARFCRAVNDANKVRSSGLSALGDYARKCYSFGYSGLLDPVSSRFYLTEARSALEEYLSCDPNARDTWIMVARLHANLGETADALHAINRVICLPEPPADAFVVGMEIAFHEGNWDALTALAAQARRAAFDMNDKDERWRNVHWWVEAAGEAEKCAPQV